MARRASLVGRIRAENPNVLLLDAGDVFQGTPYFNYYKGALGLQGDVADGLRMHPPREITNLTTELTALWRLPARQSSLS